jgi:DNA-binding NtrC family response regulator
MSEVLRPRVLLVDDEQALLHALGCALEPLGYTVDRACTLSDAGALLRSRSYAVVVTDNRLEAPDEGVRVLELVAEIQPSARRLLMTGGRVDVADHHAHALLFKPFAVSELVEAMRG